MASPKSQRKYPGGEERLDGPAPEVARSSPARKDTRRWCKGKVGRSHQIGVSDTPTYHCYPAPSWATEKMRERRGDWWCSHLIVCTVCGKRMGYLDGADCPDRPDRPVPSTTATAKG